jgi:hypothetical protein
LAEERILGLKVDVDTRRGMEEGVPVLLGLLGERRLPAAFFLSFGPDNSGRAVFKLLTNPRFALKMARTNAPGLYGFRTALYGTLLPAPLIGAALPELCRRIEAEGHEAELHAWDHRTWQDSLPRRSDAWVRDWLDRGLDAYGVALGHPPRSFGAPAWTLSPAAPFVLEGTGATELPSDLPCLEEVGGAAGTKAILSALEAGGTHVLPVHAEAEGGIWRGAFLEILDGAAALGYRVLPLSEIAARLDPATLPVRPYRESLLPGRAFPCAV